MKYTLLILVALITFSNCQDSVSYEEQLSIDSQKIDAYLAEKGLTAQKTASGLYHIITVEGTGPNPVYTSTVKIKYKGYFLNGEVFDETPAGQFSEFGVSGVVAGFGEAVTLLKKGGRGTFLLPSGLAYGTRGSGSIDPNTPLIFDIDLLEFY